MIDEVHALRKQIDACIKQTSMLQSREMSLVKTKLQEAKMWAGKVLEDLGSKLPEEYRDEAE